MFNVSSKKNHHFQIYVTIGFPFLHIRTKLKWTFPNRETAEADPWPWHPPPWNVFYFVKFWQHNTHIFSLKSTHNVYNIYFTLYSHYRNMGMCEGPQTPRNLPRPCFRYRRLSTCISVHIEWLSNRAFWVRKPKMSRKYSSFRLMIFPYSFLNNDFIYHVFTGSMS